MIQYDLIQTKEKFQRFVSCQLLNSSGCRRRNGGRKYFTENFGYTYLFTDFWRIHNIPANLKGTLSWVLSILLW